MNQTGLMPGETYKAVYAKRSVEIVSVSESKVRLRTIGGRNAGKETEIKRSYFRSFYREVTEVVEMEKGNEISAADDDAANDDAVMDRIAETYRIVSAATDDPHACNVCYGFLRAAMVALLCEGSFTTDAILHLLCEVLPGADPRNLLIVLNVNAEEAWEYQQFDDYGCWALRPDAALASDYAERLQQAEFFSCLLVLEKKGAVKRLGYDRWENAVARLAA